MSEKEKKENLPKNGNIKMQGGKSQIYWNDKWQEFSLDFIIKDMKRACYGLTPTAYVRIVHSVKKDLRSRGIFAIKDARKSIQLFKADKRIGIKELQKMWDYWMNQLIMFKNAKTGKQVNNVTKNFRDNYDKIIFK
jgi:hypothetical protein